MDALFHQGNYLAVDYTPGSAVEAGDVIVIGGKPYVAHHDIAANVPGSLAAHGGVYIGVAGGDYAPGTAVYWNASTSKFVAVAATGAHKHFGWIVPSSDPTADGQPVTVEHMPNGGVSAT